MKSYFYLSKSRYSIYALLILMVLGCKKYDDGPLISFKSKTERLTNIWMLDMVFEDGVAVLWPKGIPSGEIFGVYCDEVEIHDNNTVIFKFGSLIVNKGNWGLINDKNNIELDLKNSNNFRWDILRLKMDELWVQENNFEYRLRPK